MPSSPRTSGSISVGLIGASIQQSRSPFMHEAEARAHGLDLSYRLFDTETRGEDAHILANILRDIEQAGFAGTNITHPFKQAVMPLLDSVSEEARLIGAVNTVVFSEGRRLGYNTDAWGFGEGFRRGMPGAALERVVQIGAGGAGSATAYALLGLGARTLSLFDADHARAEALARRLAASFSEPTIEVVRELKPAVQAADGLVHATPTGMAGHPGLPLDAALLRPDLWVAEVVYFPLETALLVEARRRGARTLDGGAMAVFQAARAFELFTGATPDAERMLRRFSGLS